ncbi:hypothetical protein EW145_g8267, partial [Phellinidium pouzarii]
MLTVQCAAPLDMSPNDAHGSAIPWTWRSASALQMQMQMHSDLPTPPASVPPGTHKAAARRPSAGAPAPPAPAPLLTSPYCTSRPPLAKLFASYVQEPSIFCGHSFVSLITLTPPDDDMNSSPLWRDSKPGPSRLHSPMIMAPSPIFASPSPSPIDEDDEQYDTIEDQQDEPVSVKQEWEWGSEWRQQQQSDSTLQEETDQQHTYAEPSHHVADWVTDSQKRSAHFIAEKTCEMVCYLWFSSSL